MFVEKLMESLRAVSDAKIEEASNIVGIDSSTILEIEEALKLKLPEIYKSFLSHCGSGKNRFLVDNGFILYPRILAYKAEVLEDAEDAGESINIPENALIFRTFQSEYFWLFVCDSNHDPEVLYAEWGEEKAENTGFRLSDYLVGFFKKAIVEKQKAEKFSGLNIIEDYADEKIDSLDQLSKAIDDINTNLDIFKKPLVEMVLVDNLLKCLCRFSPSDVASKPVFELLEKLHVNEAQIATALDQNVSDLGLRFLVEFATKHDVSDSFLKQLLENS